MPVEKHVLKAWLDGWKKNNNSPIVAYVLQDFEKTILKAPFQADTPSPIVELLKALDETEAFVHIKKRLENRLLDLEAAGEEDSTLWRTIAEAIDTITEVENEKCPECGLYSLKHEGAVGYSVTGGIPHEVEADWVRCENCNHVVDEG